MISGYLLETRLESCPHGEVYRARHIQSGQTCRVRIHDAGDLASDFLRDAKLAASIFHPNLADIFEAGTLDGGDVYVIAEDPTGRSLRDVLTTNGVPTLLATIAIVRQIAEAIHALHLKQLTHLAIRPENILLTGEIDSRPSIRIHNTDLGGLMTRSIIGNKFAIDAELDSIRYFAPEQCTGEVTSARTDVYSLGIVFFEMLAGQPPFNSPKATALIEKHRTEHPPDIRIDNFDLRMLVTHTMMEALQKRPDVRQSTADLFARQLRHIEQLATHVSTPPPVVVLPKKAKRKEPTPPVEIAVARLEPEVETHVEPPVIDVSPQPTTSISPNRIEGLLDRVSRVKARLKKTRSRILPPQSPVVISIADAENQAAVEPPPKRRKIESIQPEDDLPTVQDVLAVIESEGREPIAVPPAFVETAVEPPVIAAEAVVETPIVEAALLVEPPVSAVEPIVETPVIVVAPAIVEMADLPSEPKAAELPMDPPVAVPRRASAKTKPKARRAAPSRAIPATPPVPQAERGKDPYHRISWMKGMMTDASSIKPSMSAVAEIEPEEITLVRAPRKAIRIDLTSKTPTEYPRFSATVPSEIGFAPTLLGDATRSTTAVSSRADLLFADTDAPPASHGRLIRRAAAIGVGVASLIAVFVFGDDLVEAYVRTNSSAGTIASTTTLQPAPIVATPAMTATVVKKSAKHEPIEVKPTEKAPSMVKTSAVVPVAAAASRESVNKPARVKAVEKTEKPAAVTPKAAPTVARTTPRKAVQASEKIPVGGRARIVANPRQ